MNRKRNYRWATVQVNCTGKYCSPIQKQLVFVINNIDIWADVPSDYKRTDNGPESFHAHFNEQFYKGHPVIYTFLDVLQEVQTTNYINIRHMNLHAPVSKAKKERNKITRKLYVKCTDCTSVLYDFSAKQFLQTSVLYDSKKHILLKSYIHLPVVSRQRLTHK